MLKKSIVLLIAGVCVFAAAFCGANEDAANKGAEVIVIEKGRMAEVTFPHRLHQKAMENNCNVCHDMFPQKSGIIKEMIAQEKLLNQQVMNTKCIQCHKEKKSAGLKSGPVKCTECHVRSK